ncbi:MAG: Cys-tRNA(Pro) deacylase [Clostridia bacterium]|nr:Cys-tRNA(Pro) deacylase [Clostridia bacterium]
MAEEKTNVMRLLEQSGVSYVPHSYPHGKEAVDGADVAARLGIEPQRVFKTLVTRGGGGGFFVFVLPVSAALDLKKAARAAGEKSVEMIHVAEINKVTGYVRGGCSPLGMKKAYPTCFDETALLWDAILVSAGRIGAQVEANAEALAALCGGHFADLTRA